VLGAKTPKEGLKHVYDISVKMNTYILYHGVKTPQDLIEQFEKRIKDMKDEKLELLKKCNSWKNEAEKYKDVISSARDPALCSGSGLVSRGRGARDGFNDLILND
jgi:hypothetical protein